jgi:hypothetical protein
MEKRAKDAATKFCMMTSRRKERREKKETRGCGWTAKRISFILWDDSYGSLNLRLSADGAALHWDSEVPLKASPSSFQSARFHVRRE